MNFLLKVDFLQNKVGHTRERWLWQDGVDNFFPHKRIARLLHCPRCRKKQLGHLPAGVRYLVRYQRVEIPTPTATTPLRSTSTATKKTDKSRELADPSAF